MNTADDRAPPPVPARSEKHQQDLNNLGRSWFAELREQTERETEDFANWKRDHRKWTVFNKRSQFGGENE
jgi:hypothetical protein